MKIIKTVNNEEKNSFKLNDTSFFSRKTYEKYRVETEISISNRFIQDQKNITFLLSGLTQIIKSKADHNAKLMPMNSSILLTNECLFFQKTKSPIMKAIIAVGIWE